MLSDPATTCALPTGGVGRGSWADETAPAVSWGKWKQNRMQILSCTKRLARAALLLGAGTLLVQGQSTQSPPQAAQPASQTPPAHKPGPQLPAGTGCPGGTI